jgi:hypothetical protein
MKKLIVLLAIAQCFSAPLAPKKVHLKGEIVFPSNYRADKTPEFVVTYNGMQARSDSNGFFSIPLEDYKGTPPDVLVATHTVYSFEKNNTPAHQELQAGKPYLYLKPRLDADGGYSWKQEDFKAKVVPENCLVIFMDPSFVSHTSTWRSRLKDWFVLLPRIHIKETTSAEKIEKSAAKSQLAWINHRFEKSVNIAQNECDKRTSKCFVSLPH